jgi:hypothetical protein
LHSFDLYFALSACALFRLFLLALCLRTYPCALPLLCSLSFGITQTPHTKRYAHASRLQGPLSPCHRFCFPASCFSKRCAMVLLYKYRAPPWFYLLSLCHWTSGIAPLRLFIRHR